MDSQKLAKSFYPRNRAPERRNETNRRGESWDFIPNRRSNFRSSVVPPPFSNKFDSAASPNQFPMPQFHFMRVPNCNSRGRTRCLSPNKVWRRWLRCSNLAPRSYTIQESTINKLLNLQITLQYKFPNIIT